MRSELRDGTGALIGIVPYGGRRSQRKRNVPEQRVFRSVMRRLPLLAVTAGLFSIVAGIASANAGHHQLVSCPAKLPVVLSTGQATIYRETGPRGRVFGCVPGHRRTYLGRITHNLLQSEAGAIAELTLAGAMVAFEEPKSEAIAVLNLRNGRLVARVPTAAPPTMHALQIVLASDGAVAWTVAAGFGYTGKSAAIQVRAADAAGDRQVAYGYSGEIDPTSLALAGSTLYWTQSGSSHSATLK
jgi:hypothetical protein